MEFTIGSIVFLSSLLLLAILSRISAANPDPAVLRGEIVPGLLSVLIISGLTVGFLMMVFGGEGIFASLGIELVAISAMGLASVWIIGKLLGRAPPALVA